MLIWLSLLIVSAKANWAWIGGSPAAGVTVLPPSFPQLYVESPDNSPGGLAETAYAANNSYVYLYGGSARGGPSNYLLRYNITSQMWSAIYSSSFSSANFGVLGVFSASAKPAAKSGSAVFFDLPLNALIVFGGLVNQDTDNCLFQFSFDYMMWRWLHGSINPNNQGNFGELGIESPLNVPPARGYSAYFYDQATRKGYIYGGWYFSARLLVRADPFYPSSSCSYQL
jgi:hypothetical protein